MATDLVIWLAIAFCLTQSAMFSGLNLAVFGISRLRLEVEVSAGSQGAAKVFELRKDIILLWAPQNRIITGADILGRLLRGIAAREERIATGGKS